LVSINALHVAYLARLFTPYFVKRFKDHNVRSGIAITSSGLASWPAAGMISYSSTKVFASYLGEGLYWELRDKGVDVISY